MGSEWGYRLTQKANADVEEIVGYPAVELANPRAAVDFMAKLQEVIAEMRIFPESGSPVDNEFVPDLGIRKKLVGNYLLYYLPNAKEQMIFVLRVVYGRRNVDEIVRWLNG